ncbi:bacteriocin [Companilactobacillus mindensis]|nr:bacteriocin [Companilactobacillus mindensis]GEO79728.1 hypothetical protein LMI01_20590 [Companilactobacillus mindensis]
MKKISEKELATISGGKTRSLVAGFFPNTLKKIGNFFSKHK